MIVIVPTAGHYRVAVSSVPLALRAWLARDGFEGVMHAFEAFTAENGLHCLLIMTSKRHPTYTRQLAVYVPRPGAAGTSFDDASLFASLTAFLEHDTDLKCVAFEHAAPAAAASAATAAAPLANGSTSVLLSSAA